MSNNVLIWGALVVGIILLILGLLTVLSKTFLDRLRSSVWKEENQLMKGRDGYIYDRYVTGLSTIVGGAIFIALAMAAIS